MGMSQTDGGNTFNQMIKQMPIKDSMAKQVAQVVSDFQQQRTGHAPKSATVVYNEGVLVITLHEALTPAEKALSQSPEGAEQVRQFHRELFQISLDPLRQEVERITGVAVRDAVADIEPITGAVMQVFSTGTMVQVFQLEQGLSQDRWLGKDDPSSDHDMSLPKPP